MICDLDTRNAPLSVGVATHVEKFPLMQQVKIHPPPPPPTSSVPSPRLLKEQRVTTEQKTETCKTTEKGMQYFKDECERDLSAGKVSST